MEVRSLWMLVLLAVAGALPAQMSLERALSLRARETSPMPVASSPFTVPENISEALAGMASEASVIFVGEVVQVRQGKAAVEIDFQVEAGLQGAIANSTYTLREWSGLWVNGGSRYRVGQRSLVMLHAPSAAGFSSPVGGDDGILPLHGDAITGRIDTRWLSTRVSRSAGSAPILGALPPAARQASSTSRLVQADTDAAATPKPDNLDCALVLDLLRAMTRGKIATTPATLVAGVR